MEVMIVHAGSPKRIKKLNTAISAMRIPIEFKGKKGHSPVFPYQGQIWFYKMKKEAVPTFLSFIRGNTEEVSGGGRPVQGVLNFITWAMSALARVRNIWINFRYVHIKHRKKNTTQCDMMVPDMKKIPKGPRVIDGWSYSKVLIAFPDHFGPEGDEQL